MPAVHFTDDTFDEKVLQSDKPVMVDFFAEWCGPCKMAAPIIDELSEKYADTVVIGKIDVDENSQSAMQFGVMSIPTVILFKDGKEVARKVGFGGKQGYADLLAEVVK